MPVRSEKKKGRVASGILYASPKPWFDHPYLYPALMIILLALTFIIYQRGIHYPFLNWDDNVYVTGSDLIKDLSHDGIRKIFTGIHNSNYHPLTSLSYALIYAWQGEDPYYYHLFNVIFHLLNTLLVYLFIRLLTEQRSPALITAAIFALHPMHVESVAWISEAKDMLYTFFLLLALISYRIFMRGRKAAWYIAALLAFMLSLLSKSAAVILPLLMLAVDFYMKRQDARRLITEKIPFIVLSLVFGIIAVQTQQADRSINMIGDLSIFERLATGAYGFCYYIFSFFLPVKLSALHYYPLPYGSLTALHYLSALTILLLLVWFYLNIRRRSLQEGFRREFSFGILFYTASLILVLQIIPVGRAMVAERYTYLAYAGLGFIAGQYYMLLRRKQFRRKPFLTANTLVVAMLIYLVIFSLVAWQRLPVWSSTDVLFTDVIKKYPDHGYAYMARGNSRLNSMGAQQALADYDRAIQKDPELAEAWHRRAVLKISMKQFESAIPDLNTAIRLDPDKPQPWNDRASMKYEVGYIKEAIVDYEQALSLNPDYYVALKNCGLAYYRLDQKEKAFEYLNKAILINQAYAPAWYFRGIFHLEAGDTMMACHDWHKADSLDYAQAGEKILQHCNPAE